MRFLPKSEWTLHREGPDAVIVGAHEHPPGVRYYTKFALSDLPNDFLGPDDLVGIGIDPGF